MRLIYFIIPVFILGCQNPKTNIYQVEDPIPVYNYSVDTSLGADGLLPRDVLDYIKTNLKNWEFPNTSDYNKAWWSFYNTRQIPYFVSTDLNDDNIVDYAFLLKSSDSLQLVILIGTGKTFNQWIADDFKKEYVEKDIQFGLMVQPPGRIDCVVKDEDKSLVLKSNGIALMQYEIMHKVYYWQNGKINVFLHRVYPY